MLADAGLVRVAPSQRARMAVARNVREYSAIASATATGGWLLDSVRPAVLFIAVAVLPAGVAPFSAAMPAWPGARRSPRRRQLGDSVSSSA